MNLEIARRLFDYNHWANESVLAAAGDLDTPSFTGPCGLSHGSIRGALVHVMGAEWVWRLRCQEGISPARLPDESDFGDAASLRLHWRAQSVELLRYVASLTPADYQSEISYATTSGVARSTPLWQILHHLVNHGTQFRAEAAVALTRKGHSPGDLDFIYYMRFIAAG